MFSDLQNKFARGSFYLSSAVARLFDDTLHSYIKRIYTFFWKVNSNLTGSVQLIYKFVMYSLLKRYHQQISGILTSGFQWVGISSHENKKALSPFYHNKYFW